MRGRVCHAAGPRHGSLSRVRVPWISRPYFTVSVLRLTFSSPPTTRRVTVEVFDPASTRVPVNSHSRIFLYPLGTGHAQKTQPSIVAWRRPHRNHVSRVRLRVHWSVSSAGRGADDIENTASPIVACCTVCIELLPGNALIKSVTKFNT
jgi:hypothetical protein